MRQNLKEQTDITTERLNIIPSDEERDLQLYLDDLMKKDEFLFQFGMPYSKELFEMIDFHSAPVIYYTIFLRETGAMIGYIGLTVSEHNTECGDLEFYIFKDYRRCGYCSEAVKAFSNAFFSGELSGTKGKTVTAETLSENDAVKRMLEGLGFKRECIGIRFNFTDDGEIDKSETIGTAVYYLGKKTF